MKVTALTLRLSAALLVCLLAWVFLHRTRSPEGSPTSTPYENVTSPTRGKVSEVTHIPTAPRGPVAGMPRAEKRFEVRDALSSLPIEGALAVACYSRARSLPRDSSDVVGLSDKDGFLRIESSSVPSDGCVKIVAPDYLVTEQTVLPADDDSTIVLMQRGHFVIVRCTTPDGEVLPGVRVLLSTAQFPSADITKVGADLVPGPASDRVHRAWSDEAGMAYFEGLSPGRYIASVQSDGYAVLECDPPVLDVPIQGEVAITLAPLFAAVYIIEQNELLVARHKIPSSLASTAPVADILRAENALRRRFPGAYVQVFPRTRPVTDVRVTALLKESGLVTFSVPAIQLSEIRSPHRVNARELPGTGLCFETLVEVYDRLGQPCDGEFFQLVMRAPDGGKFEIPLTYGVQWLPGGQHRIEPLDGRVTALDLPPSVSIPGDISINLGCVLQSCEVRVLDEEGREYSEYSLSISSAGRTSHHAALGLEPVSLTLPLGRSRMRLKVWGFPEREVDAEIALIEGVQVIPIAVTR